MHPVVEVAQPWILALGVLSLVAGIFQVYLLYCGITFKNRYLFEIRKRIVAWRAFEYLFVAALCIGFYFW